MEMSALQYLTSKEYGCCNTSELMALSKEDRAAMDTLKVWAREEMKKRGIEEKK